MFCLLFILCLPYIKSNTSISLPSPLYNIISRFRTLVDVSLTNSTYSSGRIIIIRAFGVWLIGSDLFVDDDDDGPHS